MKLRPGDQRLPERNSFPVIQDLVVADISSRLEVGIERYGTGLQPFNGRDSLRDLYEELLDATMYVRQVIYERDEGLGNAVRRLRRDVAESEYFSGYLRVEFGGRRLPFATRTEASDFVDALENWLRSPA